MLADASEARRAKTRMTGEDRRRLIVRTAFDLFSQNGFRGTTTRELAQAVGVSEPVLYQHFSNKRELYSAIVQHLVEEGLERYGERLEMVLAQPDGRKFLQDLGELMLAWYMDDPRLVRLLNFSALEGHELAEIWHQQAFLTFFSPVIERMGTMVAEGRLVDMEPIVLARAFMGMVGHYGILTVVFHQPQIELSRQQVIARFVDIFLTGAERR